MHLGAPFNSVELIIVDGGGVSVAYGLVVLEILLGLLVNKGIRQVLLIIDVHLFLNN